MAETTVRNGPDEIISRKLGELWEQFLLANQELPEPERWKQHHAPDCRELLDSRLGYYLRHCQGDPGKIVLGRRVHGTRDIAVGEHITYDPAGGRFLLGVPRARPWSHGFDRLNWYLIPATDPGVILRNLIADRPVQTGLELYKTQY